MIQSGYIPARAVRLSGQRATFTGQMRVALKPEYAMGVSHRGAGRTVPVVALLGVLRDHVTPFNVDRRPARL